MAGLIDRNPYEVSQTYFVSYKDIETLNEWIENTFGVKNINEFTLKCEDCGITATIKSFNFDNFTSDDIVTVSEFRKNNNDKKKKWFNL